MNIQPAENEGQFNRLRSEMADFLHGLPASLAVTLRYESGPIQIATMCRHLRHMHAFVDNKIYGRRFAMSPVRTSYWFVAETIDSNPHMHGGWHFYSPKDAALFATMLQDGLWEHKFASGGTHDAQIITGDDQRTWAGYAIKRLSSPDNVLLSPNIDVALPKITVV